jgi:hypothetical protein
MQEFASAPAAAQYRGLRLAHRQSAAICKAHRRK